LVPETVWEENGMRLKAGSVLEFRAVPHREGE
jgi:hypothetical protein